MEKNRISRNNGLTLIELMMVVLIIAVISSIALPLGKIQFVRGREEDLKGYLQAYRRGLDKFYDNAPGSYPKSLREMVLAHWLRRVPREPFGNKWQYRTSSDPPDTWRDFNFYGASYEVTNPLHDIYDIRSDGSHVDTALDGSSYSSW